MQQVLVQITNPPNYQVHKNNTYKKISNFLNCLVKNINVD